MRLNAPPDTLTARSLDVPLGLPITTWVGDDFKRFLAAGVPVTPVNLALRSRFEGHAGRASLRSYEYAVGLFLTFMAKRNLSLLAVSDSDFDAFVRALTGRAYADADGRPTVLPGQRGEVTANNIVSRLYGLFGDIGSAYGIEFEWRRFRRLARRGRWGDPAVQGPRIRREHGYRTPIKEPRGIPDEQLAKGLVHAQKIWGAEVADGDRAYAPDRETQGGALLWRNLAILFALRFAGARRAEVGPINLTDIDRERGDISLVTKGRHGARERVVLVPTLANAIAKYLFEFRPLVAISKRDGEPQSIDRQAVFVSHSVANYGRRVSAETIRLVVEALRPALDEPWRTEFSPHSLRHAFAYDIQRHVGLVAVSANLRHRSNHSADAYRAAASQWAPELTAMSDQTASILRDHGVWVPG